MDKPVIILGAKGIAHPALEIFNSNQVIVYGLLDEDSSLHGTEINNVPVLGGTEDEGFLKLIGKKTEAFVAVDDTKYRKFLVELLLENRKMQPINAIHERAYISTWDVAGKAVRGYSVGVYRGDDYRSVGYYPRTLKEAKACAEKYYALLNN